MQSENNLVKFDVEKLNTGRLVHLCLLPLSAIVSAITQWSGLLDYSQKTANISLLTDKLYHIWSYCINKKKKKYHTFEKIQKSNIKIVERDKVDICNTQIIDLSLELQRVMRHQWSRNCLPPVFSGVCIAQSVLCTIVFCRSLFVRLSFFFQPLYCL